ncbi:hypothetical protein GH714_026949 [Hevea brasiliensis]|uniref:Uncharacterized protein n=1 Tax=Hevea brasiliensis TaxID=3981 RepID=A0A6A6ND40_HEVBR|nr:hypothetical protein GH714_026949 [Hevea brasiliensis]
MAVIDKVFPYKNIQEIAPTVRGSDATTSSYPLPLLPNTVMHHSTNSSCPSSLPNTTVGILGSPPKTNPIQPHVSSTLSPPQSSLNSPLTEPSPPPPAMSSILTSNVSPSPSRLLSRYTLPPTSIPGLPLLVDISSYPEFESAIPLDPPLPQSTNTHPMVTCSKTGHLKPKAFFATTPLPPVPTCYSKAVLDEN